MQMDRETFSKLLGMSDNDFRNKVKSAATAAGINDPRLDILLRDSGALKKMLADMSESDMKKMAAALGQDKIDQMMANIKNGMKF